MPQALKAHIASGKPNYTPEGGTDMSIATLRAKAREVVNKARTRWVNPADEVPRVAQDLIDQLARPKRLGGTDLSASVDKRVRDTTKVSLANLAIDIAPIAGTKNIALDIRPLNAKGKVRRFVLTPENNYFISDQRVYDTIARLHRIGAKFKAKTLKAGTAPATWRGVGRGR